MEKFKTRLVFIDQIIFVEISEKLVINFYGYKPAFRNSIPRSRYQPKGRKVILIRIVPFGDPVPPDRLTGNEIPKMLRQPRDRRPLAPTLQTIVLSLLPTWRVSLLRCSFTEFSSHRLAHFRLLSVYL